MNKNSRDLWIDNTKGILILLVVVGHFCASLVKYSGTIELLYKLINFFHMPCFLMLSAYLSKSRIQKKQYAKIIERLIIPYLIAQLALWLFACIFPGGLAVFGKDYQTSNYLIWLKPNYHLWFLFALIVYHIITPLLPQNRAYLCIATAFVLSILIGYAPEIHYLRFTKIVAYYPYFLIGYFSDKHFWLQVRGQNHKYLKIVAFIIIAGWISFFALYKSHINSSIFPMATNYALLIKRGTAYPALQRTLFLLGSTVISFCVINLVPNKTGIFTQLGVRSMYPYILHGFFVVAVRAANNNIMPIFKRINSVPEFIVYIALSILLTYLLASKWSLSVFRPFLEPHINIFRRLNTNDISSNEHSS